MTVIHACANTPFPYLIADCALSRKGFLLKPLKLPMDGNRKARASLHGATVKRLQQKALVVTPHIVAAYAGDTSAGRIYLEYLKANSVSLTSLSALKEFFFEVPQLPPVSNVIGREFVIVGLCVDGQTRRAFQFKFPDREWLEDSEITVGSGTEVVKRIFANSQTKVLKPSEQFRDAERKFISLVAYLIGHEGFTSEPHRDKFGGAYTGFIHNGSSFCENAPFVTMHWSATVSIDGKIEQQAQPVIVDSQWIDDWMLIRRAHAKGGKRQFTFIQDEWLIPPLLSNLGYPEDQGFDEILFQCLEKDYFSKNFLLVSEIICRGKAIQMSAYHTLHGDADDAAYLTKSGNTHEFKIRDDVIERNIDLALLELRQKGAI